MGTEGDGSQSGRSVADQPQRITCGGPRMRRVLVMATLAALVIGTIPSTVGAARATRMTSDGLGMACLLVSEEQGTIYIEVFATSDQGGFAGMYWWAPGLEPFEAPPTLISGENSVTGEPSGDTLDATM